MANEKRLVWTKDVMSFLCKRCNEMYSDELCEPSDCLMMEELEKCPTVDAVEVVHGRWIMRGGKRYCSACQQKACVTRDTDDFWYTIGTNYCPNCGAKMDGDGNG